MSFRQLDISAWQFVYRWSADSRWLLLEGSGIGLSHDDFDERRAIDLPSIYDTESRQVYEAP